MALKTPGDKGSLRIQSLTSETVESTSLSLEGVDDIKSSDGLSASVLGVSDSVLDNRLEERLENTSGLLVDEGRDSLDTTSTSQSSDGRLGDTLNVVSQDLSVSLRTALSQTFSSFAST
jgi:hypothetical protein